MRAPAERWRDSYVFIDWGPEFRADHALNHADVAVPGVYLELGSLSVQYLIDRGASGYVPRRTAAVHLESGALRLVPKAPVFSYPAYATYPGDGEPELIDPMLETLRLIADEMQG